MIQIVIPLRMETVGYTPGAPRGYHATGRLPGKPIAQNYTTLSTCSSVPIGKVGYYEGVPSPKIEPQKCRAYKQKLSQETGGPGAALGLYMKLLIANSAREP